ncbi:uncharacterized protein JCM15063_001044 [Sporobolomyces koalae]|uniref:uncharacterized protein n=1 Tax=Sporobolomyces koalae TaxID=500713 RepID=UPI0031778590
MSSSAPDDDWSYMQAQIDRLQGVATRYGQDSELLRRVRWYNLVLPILWEKSVMTPEGKKAIHDELERFMDGFNPNVHSKEHLLHLLPPVRDLEILAKWKPSLPEENPDASPREHGGPENVSAFRCDTPSWPY